jgi:hypothetical protein
MIIFISEYYINSISLVAFYLNFLEKQLPIEIDTTILNTALLGQLDDYGYEPDQPCNARIYAHGTPPLIKLSQEYGVSLTSQLGLDFKCKKSNDTEYFQVFTILSNQIDFTGTVSKFTISPFNFSNYSFQSRTTSQLKCSSTTSNSTFKKSPTRGLVTSTSKHSKY